MYVPDEKLKINKFVQVAIPRTVEFVKRFGNVSPASSLYSGDELAPLPETKMDSLADIDRYDQMMQREELEKSDES